MHEIFSSGFSVLDVLECFISAGRIMFHGNHTTTTDNTRSSPSLTTTLYSKVFTSSSSLPISLRFLSYRMPNIATPYDTLLSNIKNMVGRIGYRTLTGLLRTRKDSIGKMPRCTSYLIWKHRRIITIDQYVIGTFKSFCCNISFSASLFSHRE